MVLVPSTSIDELTADTYLLDVREPAEWVAGRAPAAHHIPMGEVPARLAELPTDRSIAVICRSGARSHDVAAYLRLQHGFEAVNVAGGMQAWAHSGRPLVADGPDARVI